MSPLYDDNRSVDDDDDDDDDDNDGDEDYNRTKCPVPNGES